MRQRNRSTVQLNRLHDTYARIYGVQAPALDASRDRDRAILRGVARLLPRVVSALGREAAQLDEEERAAMTWLEGIAACSPR